MNTDKQKKDKPKKTLSEAGSSFVNAETTMGGADSVPDTPDVNIANDEDGRDLSVRKDKN
ncbi:hypothetical protein K0651_08500 [Ornithinimicrobium sp. Arc0846-15]|nr:hypothetical protein [Ornithinimicrobium laminariae]